VRAHDLSASYATMKNRYRLIGIFNKHNGIHYLSYLIDSEGHLFQSCGLRVINVQETHPCRITHAAGQLTWLRSVMRVQCTSLRDHSARIIAFFSFFYSLFIDGNVVTVMPTPRTKCKMMQMTCRNCLPSVSLCIERPSWQERGLKSVERGIWDGKKEAYPTDKFSSFNPTTILPSSKRLVTERLL